METSNIFKGVLHSYFECKINILEIRVHVRVFAKNTSTSQKKKAKKEEENIISFRCFKIDIFSCFFLSSSLGISLSESGKQRTIKM